MQDLGQDVRFALRTLVKSPVVTGAAVVSLALAIGANTAVFSIVDAIFLRGLPVEEAERLVMVHAVEKDQLYGELQPVSRPNFLDFKRRTQPVFASLSESCDVTVKLEAGGDTAEIVRGRLVSAEYFTTFGVKPHLGRFFEAVAPGGTAAEDSVVVLTHRFWTQRFGADPAVIGRTLHLSDQPLTVIGIAPRDFVGPMVLTSSVFWAPISQRSKLAPAEPYDDRQAPLTWTVARLRDGVSEDQAEALVQTIGTHLRRTYPEANRGREFATIPISYLRVPFFLRQRYVDASRLLAGLAALVLVIACANVASLQVGRSAARRGEMAVRQALGASRGRLVRQLLVESLVLAGAAGLLGILFAVWGRNALWAMRPAFMLNSGLAIDFDSRPLVFSLLVTLSAGVFLGLYPALRFSRPSPATSLARSGPQRSGLSRIYSRRQLLVMAQIALALVALHVSGLFLKSLGNAVEIDSGFEPEGLVTLRLNPSYLSPGHDRTALLERVARQARSVPGVTSASLTNLAPFAAGGRWRTAVADGGDSNDEAARLLLPTGHVGLDFFSTTGIEVLRGRYLEPADRHGAPVAVVNETAAARLWPGQQTLGRRFRYTDDGAVFEVVGVVNDTDYVNVGEPKMPLAFLPRLAGDVSANTLVIRTPHGRSAGVIEALRRRIGSLEPDLPVSDIRTGPEWVRQRLWSAHLGARLLSALGAIALLMTVVGVYAIMAYTTIQRSVEVLIRMALGAERGDVLRLIVAQAMAVVGLGLLLGGGLAAWAGRLVTGMLHGVPPADPATFAAAAVVLGIAALGACLLPAWRVAGSHPGRILRAER